MRKKILQLLMPKPNVPITKKEKLLRDLKITKQKVIGGTEKLKQTQFERANPQFKGKNFTFETKTGKSESNRERYKRIQKENTKAFKSMIDDAFKNVKKEKKATGGRVGKMGGGMMGRRFGYSKGTPKPKTNVEKIKEAFSSKGKNLKPVDKKKNPGLSKLPTKVRNKMGYMKKGGRAGFKGGTPMETKSGATRPRPDSLFDPNNPINKRKKDFKQEAKKDMK